jgi:hypothetical protein
MKKRGFVYLSAFVALLLMVGVACASSSTSAGSAATMAPAATSSGSGSSATATTASSSALVTWTDQNKYFSIQVPGDWQHSQTVDKNKNFWYWDVIASPDNNARVESVVYDDGTPWTGSQNGQAALTLLNQFYSKTGQEGDIRISNDSIQPDKSERLTWASKTGNYSGVSYFEVRIGRPFSCLPSGG